MEKGPCQSNSGSISTNNEIDALGRIVQIGTLYDARTGVFHDSISLFDQDPKIDSVDNKGSGTGGIKYTLATSIVDNLNLMNVSGELKFNILTGLYEVEGSSTYFKKSKSTEKKVKGTLVYPISTVYESVNLSSSYVQSIIRKSALDYNCTHVVVGIKWGGNAIFYVEDINSCTESQTQLELVLKSLKIHQVPFNIKGNIKSTDKSKNYEDHFHIEIMGDISPEVPKDVETAIGIMKKVPQLIKEANSGKGKPVKYILAPISNIRELMNLKLLEKQKIVNIDEEVVTSCDILFKNLYKFNNKLSDLVDDLEIFEKYIRPSKVDQVNKLKQEYDMFLAQVKSEVRRNLIDVRTGIKSIEELKTLITNKRENPYSWTHPEMERINELIEEILFIKQMISNDVEILSNELPLQTYLRKGYPYSFILFYKDEFSSEPQQCMTIFLKLLKDKDLFHYPHFAVSNYKNIAEQTEQESLSKISLYIEGQLVEEHFNQQDHLEKYFEKISSTTAKALMIGVFATMALVSPTQGGPALLRSIPVLFDSTDKYYIKRN